MKTLKFLSLFFLITMIAQSCLKDDCTATRRFVQYNPVFMTGAELKYEIKTQPDQALVNPGKIYFYNNYLFINEQGLGVHVYNNSNPENPIYEVFYNIPGNFDIAIKDDMMYADNPLYLLAIDIKEIKKPVLKNRQKILAYDWYYENDEYSHVIYYLRTNVVQTLDCSDNNFNAPFFRLENNIFADVAFDGNVLNSNTVNGGSIKSGGTGVGGSNSRFTIYDHYLYTVDFSALNVWDLKKLGNPEKISTKQLGWGIETIFPYQDKLFIGSTSGMFIFDNSDPSNPIQTAQFRHAQACDPIVVNGNRAYVTLRDGNECNGFKNQLDVLDVSNIYNPKLLKSYDMRHPHGLAIRENNLFICEGNFGLKIFDASDDNKITNNQLADISNIHAIDIIALTSKTIFVIGEGGFFQYNVEDVKKPKLISSILVQN